MEKIYMDMVDKRFNENEAQLVKISDSVDKLRENVHKLLGRNNDIVIKLVNGRTEERLASEVIGELYYAQKSIAKSLDSINEKLESSKIDSSV